MKRTITISEPLLAEAKRIAWREGLSVRALVEEGLRQAIASRCCRQPFVLRNASFRGQGVRPGVVEGGWSKLLYADRDFSRFPLLQTRNPLV